MIGIKFDGERTLEEQDRERMITDAELTDPTGTVSLPLVHGHIMTEHDMVIEECPLCGAGHFHRNHNYKIGDIMVTSVNCDKSRDFVRKYESYAIEIVGEIDPKKFRKYEARKPNKKRVIHGHIPRFYLSY